METTKGPNSRDVIKNDILILRDTPFFSTLANTVKIPILDCSEI